MTTPEPPAPDPSMEDILASIRRILADGEEEAAPAHTAFATTPPHGQEEPAPHGSARDMGLAAAPPPDEVFVLDRSMMIDEPSAALQPGPSLQPAPELAAEPWPEPPQPPARAPAWEPAREPAPSPEASHQPEAGPQPEPPVMPAEAAPMHDFSHLDAGETPAEPLLGATASAATSASLGALVRVVSQRQTSVYAGGPTLEDMVRAEIRPMVKTWLDEHLAPMVERLVRAEIDRVSALNR